MFNIFQKKNFFFSILCFFALFSACLWAKTPLAFAQSEQRYVYDVSYKSIAVGKIIRELRSEGGRETVNTTAELSFLFYHFGGNQLTRIYWDDSSEQFLTEQFVRNNVGFTTVSMQAEFFKEGHQTRITRDGEVNEFTNETEKIIDFNAIGLQISQGLKSGQTHFEFYMQTSDSVAHYFFEVTGKEVLDTKFGKLATYRLEQTRREDRKLTAWFAPDVNYQMVKFHYKRNLLDLHGVISERSMISL
ncbi:MAG: hypothetical protein ACJAT7_000208 [Psychromonas sp.]|jgi:hypothetical protein|uniref:DUF3108 domain-containing protein n=1 Tax=Psychromonas sp. TaxID=1884585 RepID=UPI0039E6FA78